MNFMYDDLLGERRILEKDLKKCQVCGYCKHFNKWDAYMDGTGWCKTRRIGVTQHCTNFYREACKYFEEID